MRSVVAALAVVAVFATVSTASGAGRSARLLWSGTFEHGMSAWTDVQSRSGGVTVIPAPGRPGTAARFLVRPGDVPIGRSGERAEVYKETGEQAGTESFWAWSVYFPRGSSSSPNSSWNVFTQWHQSVTGGVQPLSFEITNDRGREWIRLRSWGGNAVTPARRAWRLAPLVRGRWYDFALHVRWAPDRTGLLQVWLDQKQVVPKTRTPTLYSGESVYLKQGFYRSPSAVVSEVYIARTRRGASLRDIGIDPAAKAHLAARAAVPRAAAPQNPGRPEITGTAKQGAVLTSSTGSWAGGVARLAYQWQWSRNNGKTWLDVHGATRPTFDVTATFVGAMVRVVVTASKAASFTRAASAAVSLTG